MKKLLLTDGGETFEVWLKISCYRNGNLKITLLFWNEDFRDIWTFVTADSGMLLCGKDCAYIDTYTNGQEILDWLVKNKLATPMRRADSFGGCTYPIYQFNSKMLKHLDPEGYADYINGWKQWNMLKKDK